MKRDRHSEIVERRSRKSASHRKAFARTQHQIDLAQLVCEMRDDPGLTQAELARKAGTTASVTGCVEDAEWAGGRRQSSFVLRTPAVCPSQNADEKAAYR